MEKVGTGRMGRSMGRSIDTKKRGDKEMGRYWWNGAGLDIKGWGGKVNDEVALNGCHSL